MAGSSDRRALAIAGDDADAKILMTEFLDELGFDTVDAGPLSESWRLERDQPAYAMRFTARELRASLALAKRDKNSTATS